MVLMVSLKKNGFSKYNVMTLLLGLYYYFTNLRAKWEMAFSDSGTYLTLSYYFMC